VTNTVTNEVFLFFSDLDDFAEPTGAGRQGSTWRRKLRCARVRSAAWRARFSAGTRGANLKNYQVFSSFESRLRARTRVSRQGHVSARSSQNAERIGRLLRVTAFDRNIIRNQNNHTLVCERPCVRIRALQHRRFCALPCLIKISNEIKEYQRCGQTEPGYVLSHSPTRVGEDKA
jgi:hypothetical protein